MMINSHKQSAAQSDTIWVNLQRSHNGNLFIWRGAEAIGISAEIADDEILPRIKISAWSAALLDNGDIIPVRAPRAMIEELWSEAHREEEEA